MIAVVVPTNRADRMAEWLRRWNRFDGLTKVYIVEDGPAKTFIAGEHIEHFSWCDIDCDLGDKAWIIPRKTDCVRSYGFLRAYRDGATHILTLDDDCYPVDGMTAEQFVEAHRSRFEYVAYHGAWQSTIDGAIPRGVPYIERARAMPPVLNHGLWQNVPDLDAATQLSAYRSPVQVQPCDEPIPVGAYFPMCGMNLAWRRDLTPAMWFGLQGQPTYPYDRFGDIWCGLFVKRICDHLRLGVWSGTPQVHHDRASNVWANLRKEAPGMEINETLWQHVDAVRLTGRTVAECYVELADGLALDDPYWLRVREGMRVWAGLCNA